MYKFELSSLLWLFLDVYFNLPINFFVQLIDCIGTSYYITLQPEADVINKYKSCVAKLC